MGCMHSVIIIAYAVEPAHTLVATLIVRPLNFGPLVVDDLYENFIVRCGSWWQLCKSHANTCTLLRLMWHNVICTKSFQRENFSYNIIYITMNIQMYVYTALFAFYFFVILVMSTATTRSA